MKTSELIFAVMATSKKMKYSIYELIQLCSLFDINESQLRTNLSRMSANGLLASIRRGKNAYYMFTDKGNAMKKNVASSFKSLDWKDWDEKWWGISFSVPDVEKSERHYIRKKLLAYRFVSFNPGFWIRPLNKKRETGTTSGEYFFQQSLQCNKVFLFNKIPAEQISTLWDLENKNENFKYGLNIINESRKRIKNLTSKDAFKEKIVTGNIIVNILFEDPLLPEVYLPEVWAAEKLKSEFILWNKEITEISKMFFENLDNGGN